MNAVDLDRTEEGTLTDEVSDEVLEVAAGALSYFKVQRLKTSAVPPIASFIWTN